MNKMEKKERIRKERRINFSVTIGPLLKEVLSKQKRNVIENTLDVCSTSDWEAGEIIAKKITANDLV
jgi:ribosome biogenesis protein Tsr3